MNFFQVPYDAIKRWKCRWLCDFLGYIQKKILAPALMAVGQAGLSYIRMKIEEQSKLDLPGREKFENVFKACKLHFRYQNIEDDVLDGLIQNAYLELKDKGVL
jgi:hypothetical protein